MVPVAGSAPGKSKSGISVFNLVMIVVAIVFGAIAFLRVQSVPSAVQSSPTYYNPPVQPAYPQVEVTPVYPQAPATPVYPNRDAQNEGTYYIRTDGHDQHR